MYIHTLCIVFKPGMHCSPSTDHKFYSHGYIILKVHNSNHGNVLSNEVHHEETNPINKTGNAVQVIKFTVGVILTVIH